MPVSAIGPSLIIAMVNPNDASTFEEVALLTGLKIEVVSASHDEIEASIAACYGDVN